MCKAGTCNEWKRVLERRSMCAVLSSLTGVCHSWGKVRRSYGLQCAPITASLLNILGAGLPPGSLFPLPLKCSHDVRRQSYCTDKENEAHTDYITQLMYLLSNKLSLHLKISLSCQMVLPSHSDSSFSYGTIKMISEEFSSHHCLAAGHLHVTPEWQGL